jgi:hypothetical protein
VLVETNAYFAVRSDEMTPEAMAAGIGADPTRVMRRGERGADPILPATNAWMLDSGLGRDEPLWRHLQALHLLVEPVTAAIAVLCAGDPAPSLIIVRSFRAGDGEADLGFWLDDSWMAVLRATGAHLDVDEYDHTANYSTK